MRNEVLEFTFVSKLSGFSSKLSQIKKQLWKVNRKSFNQLKTEAKEVDKLRERTSYYVMSGNEVYVHRGLEVLDELKKLSQSYVNSIMIHGNEKSQPFIDELKQLLDEIEALRVMIRLSSHEKSFFA